ncbi:hypothetical protein PGT21_012612 [Puccinia graminis f. sp. tritici]|uniref:Uncharacterized protein n=1 Tax=Puccinia graminis f. sp. tritici TaxID=56615 RepID=A0A5B0QMN4_PUCGR|nr:hypothetical protein PGT21_012612 [Puccinia graminis f. sp. tritici]
MLRRSPTSVLSWRGRGDKSQVSNTTTKSAVFSCSTRLSYDIRCTSCAAESFETFLPRPPDPVPFHPVPVWKCDYRLFLSRPGPGQFLPLRFLLEPGEPTKLVDSLPHPSPSSFSSSSFSSSCSPPYGRLVSSTQLRSPLPPAPPQSPHISRHQEESLGQKTQTQVLGSTSFRRIRDSQRRRKSRET